jgi:dienelactone hydrolase
MMPRNGIVIGCGLALALMLPIGADDAGEGEDPPGYPDHSRLMVVRDNEGHESPVRSRADWQRRRSHILANVQKVMGPLPGVERRVPLNVEVVAEFDEPLYLRRKITYASEPGNRVPAWLLIPKEGKGRRPAVLALHQTVKIGKDEPVGLGGRTTLRYGKELAERGYFVLAPDYPNFGEHTVDVYALGYASASMKAIWDNMRGVDVLMSLPQVDPERIGVIGHSLGGHNSIFMGVFDDRIRAVVSSCGFNSFAHYYGGDLTGWSHKGYMPRIASLYGRDPKRMPFDFPELIGALAPRGFFTNSPKWDENFELEGVRLCIAAARPVYELLGAGDRLQAVYPDAEHDFPDAQRHEAYAFLDRVLRAGE